MLKKGNDDYLAKLRQSYAAQLKRRESEIERLKRENDILMKTSIRQSENTVKWMEYAKKLEQKIKKD